jgi:integrase
MPKHSKSAPSLPKLFKRGQKFYFRRKVNNTDQWVATGKEDLAEAKEFAADYMRAEAATVLASRKEKIAHRLAEQFVESFTGKEEILIPIREARRIWLEHTPKYGDLSDGSRGFYETIFARFAGWCEAQGITYVEEVDHSAAVRYSKFLLESGITGRTYNGHLKHLSGVFSTVDAVTPLPHRDPFHYRKVPRISKGELHSIGRQPLEPDMLKAVLAKSGAYGVDYRDLFVIGSQTGMRLKDAALLRWDCFHDGFIELTPFKTVKSGGTARMPVSPVLNQVLERRWLETAGAGEYVLPAIAEQYQQNHHYVTKLCKRIFEEALGKEKTVVSAEGNAHRMRNACIYSFHSFRTTLMSLLAAKDVSTRDAMRMLGWESPEMIRVYEKMLEEARGDADKRAVALVNSIEQLQYDVPEVVEQETLRPSDDMLRALVDQYSNRTIGRLFDVSDVAVGKWMAKYGIKRARRILSGDVSDEEIAAIRERLKGGAR